MNFLPKHRLSKEKHLNTSSVSVKMQTDAALWLLLLQVFMELLPYTKTNSETTLLGGSIEATVLFLLVIVGLKYVINSLVSSFSCPSGSG